MTRVKWWRAVVLAAVIALLMVDTTEHAEAANPSQFDPGFIISDEQFYDANSMTAAQIQAFLESKVSRCEVEKSYGPHDPIVCLKDYRMNTVTIPADAYCTGTYAGASNELASTIIYKVAQACGINPKVLLVTLQKEQGLVTHTWPSSYRYDKAMGFACPDTAPCDTQYFGFQNQVWRAARQFQRYKAHPSNYNYRAGMINTIYYYPPNQRPQCGASSVYIKNVATASLYNYTPYQPNQAALSNLYGTGNECSSYGNRNFWRDYSDWFGNPARPICATNPRTGIDEYWTSTGGASGPFGALAAQGYVSISGGGMIGHFTKGAIVCSPTAGVVPVLGEIYVTYIAQGGATGYLGLPSGAAEAWSAGGVSGQLQYFAGGMVLSSTSTGTHAVPTGIIRTTWGNSGGSGGSLGWPTSSATSWEGATIQKFQRGAIVATSANSAILVSDAIGAYFVSGTHSEELGRPLAAPVPWTANGVTGVYQEFARGMVMSSSKTGTYAVLHGPIRNEWGKAGGSGGPYGWPISDQVVSGGITWQNFQGGEISTAGGNGGPSDGTADAIEAYWLSSGHKDVLGPARGNTVTWNAGGVSGFYRDYANGMVMSSSSTGTHAVLMGPIRTVWGGLGGSGGSLGWPTADQVSVTGVGTSQAFQHGTVIVNTKGVGSASSGAILDYWSAGTRARTLKAPLALPVTWTANGVSGQYQNFEGGMVMSSNSTGTYAVLLGPIRTVWGATGGSGGTLGWPTGDAIGRADGGVHQQFQKGVAAFSSSGVGGEMTGAIAQYWLGGDHATALGYPVGSPVAWKANGVSGTYQNFENGMVMSSTATGTYAVLMGPVRTLWGANGGSGGSLGWPIGDQEPIDDGIRQRFQNGYVVVPNRGNPYIAAP